MTDVVFHNSIAPSCHFPLEWLAHTRKTKKVISRRAYIKEKEKCRMDHLSSHLGKLGGEGQQKTCQAGRLKGLLKGSPEIGEWKNRKTRENR